MYTVHHGDVSCVQQHRCPRAWFRVIQLTGSAELCPGPLAWSYADYSVWEGLWATGLSGPHRDSHNLPCPTPSNPSLPPWLHSQKQEVGNRGLVVSHNAALCADNVCCPLCQWHQTGGQCRQGRKVGIDMNRTWR